MIKINENLWVGSLEDYKNINEEDFAIVHATKSIFDARKAKVIYEEDNHIYLNWVDSSNSKYFDYEGNGCKVVNSVLDFIDKWIGKRKVLIHCDEGKSRSASLAMVYMAKRLRVISNKDHVYAERDFSDVYPYSPGVGISDFLFYNWFKIK